MKICPYCLSEIANNAKKCKYCDEVVIGEKKVKLCPYCEAEVSETAKKCKHCGERINGEQIKDDDKNEKIKTSHMLDGSTCRSILDNSTIYCPKCGYKGLGGRLQGNYGGRKLLGLFGRSIKDRIIGYPVCCPHCKNKEVEEIEVLKASSTSKIRQAFLQFFRGILVLFIILIIVGAMSD